MVCLVQTKPSLRVPSDTPLCACQPRSTARETSLGMAQMAVPCQAQRGGGYRTQTFFGVASTYSTRTPPMAFDR
ncbi:hypothetical protein D3C72_2036910 [compost metagenome]